MLSFLIAARSSLHARMQEPADRGATAVEYSLIVSMVAGVIIAIVFTLGQQTDGLFASATDALAEAGVSGSTE